MIRSLRRRAFRAYLRLTRSRPAQEIGLCLILIGVAITEVLIALGSSPHIIAPVLVLAIGLVIQIGGLRAGVASIVSGLAYGVGRSWTLGAETAGGEVVGLVLAAGILSPGIMLWVRSANETSRRWTRIHARLQAWSDLKAVRRQHRAFLNGIEALVWEMDPVSGEVRLINSYAETMLGYPAEQTAAAGFSWELVHPEDLDTLKATLAAVLRDGRTRPVEYRIARGTATQCGSGTPSHWRPSRTAPCPGCRASGSTSRHASGPRTSSVHREGALPGAVRERPGRAVPHGTRRQLPGGERRAGPHPGLLQPGGVPRLPEERDLRRGGGALALAEGAAPQRRVAQLRGAVPAPGRADDLGPQHRACGQGGERGAGVLRGRAAGHHGAQARGAGGAERGGEVPRAGRAVPGGDLHGAGRDAGVRQPEDGRDLRLHGGRGAGAAVGVPPRLRGAPRPAPEVLRRSASSRETAVRSRSTAAARTAASVEVEVHCTRATFNDAPAVLGTLLDITARKEAEDRLFHAAYHDALTGFPTGSCSWSGCSTRCGGSSGAPASPSCSWT
jgi:PAS domain-containing protein